MSEGKDNKEGDDNRDKVGKQQQGKWQQQQG
jgi:hypothetical protein